MDNPIPKAAYSIREFEQVLGVSHSTAYEMINAGELRTFKIGRRRFVSAESLRDLILKLEAAAA